MLIISIDGSINHIGWCKWHWASFTPKPLSIGVFETHGADELAKARYISSHLRNTVLGPTYSPVEYLVIEKVYIANNRSNRNPQSILKLSMSVGAIVGSFGDAMPHYAPDHLTKAKAITLAASYGFEINKKECHSADALSVGHAWVSKMKSTTINPAYIEQ